MSAKIVMRINNGTISRMVGIVPAFFHICFVRIYPMKTHAEIQAKNFGDGARF